MQLLCTVQIITALFPKMLTAALVLQSVMQSHIHQLQFYTWKRFFKTRLRNGKSIPQR